MAKKKSKKKDKDSKKSEKKKLLKLKLKKEKSTGKKKKEGKKKAEKKKAEKKKDGKKEKKKKEGKKKGKVAEEVLVPESLERTVSQPEPELVSDSSQDYNAQNALVKMRSLKTREEILAFTKGETRVTVTRSIQAAINNVSG